MGIARGIFVIDTHVHAVRVAMKFKERGVKPTYEGVFGGMSGKVQAVTYDNSERLLYHMDRYGVDMSVIMTLGGDNETLMKIIKKHPDRFIGRVMPSRTARRARDGEAQWSVDAACEELDELLGTGLFRGGVGEGMPGNPFPDEDLTWKKRYEEICQVMEVVRKHNVPVSWHTPMGTLSGYAGASRSFAGQIRFEDPLLVHELATTFPDVPIIMSHGGMQGWWSEMYMEPTLNVAAGHDNVYLETGLWWADLYDQPLRDPNIGPEKLIWGTDWGASIPQQWQPGRKPTTYANQSRRDGIPAHQIDVFGWSLRQLDKLDIPQDDLNLILGGNAVRIFRLEDKMPHTRLFKQYLKP